MVVDGEEKTDLGPGHLNGVILEGNLMLGEVEISLVCKENRD